MTLRLTSAIAVLALAVVPSFGASLAGIWIGEQTKDPITDRPFSLAMIYDQADNGAVSLRCKNGALDILVTPKDPQFKVGERQKVALRFDSAEPITLEGIATEPRLLALNHQRDTKVLLPFLTAKSIAIRFSGVYGRDYTLQLISVLPPNSLSKVGRVLADCDVAPYPQDQIEKAAADFREEALRNDPSSAPKKKSRR